MRSSLRLEQLGSRLVPAILNIQATALGVFRNGTWILDTNTNHQLDAGDTTFIYGAPTDTPITGDWNGSGHTAVGVFRDVNGIGQFILDYNNDHKYDAGDKVFYFGLGTDKPVVGDWSGSGNDKVGIFRNVNGTGEFVLDTNGHYGYDSSSTVFNYGVGTGIPVAGDWNGSGQSKVGVFSGGIFTLDYNGNHTFDTGDQKFYYGIGTDTPVIGDWQGAQRDSVGVVRNNGHGGLLWVVDSDNNQRYDGGDSVYTFGLTGDKPVVGQW